MVSDLFSSSAFEARYTYQGNDLGASWTPEKTLFRVWAPTASAVAVHLYRSGGEISGDFIEALEMTADVNGTWLAAKYGDLNGVYYTYAADINGKRVEVCDPYAKAVGVNGRRAMVIDLASTDPDGWENDADPHAGDPITDAVIYELHIRDLSVDASSGIRNKGKYLGLTETGTAGKKGIPTGLDHIKDLGITHLQILPMYDYGSVDESDPRPQFNWGYDPVNYNAPEGSYASDPYDGAVRIRELKQMIKGLHDNGISVVMDVVYNHVFDADSFCFNQLVPACFSRTDSSGHYTDGSGCGNETASERAMVSKYIVDSVKYWAQEYHIDGFRFDLVGLIDTVTVNEIIRQVHAVNPNVIFYGEGWNMPAAVTKEGFHMANQDHADKVPEFAFFNDTFRDSLRGSVFLEAEKGYISGACVPKEILERCWMGATQWAQSPAQSINYISCHDNHTLMDKITLSTPKVSRAARVRMCRLAAAFTMTAQGVPFFQAGEEMLRSKPLGDGAYDHNSYTSPDSVNSIKWDKLSKAEYRTTCGYYKGLIAFRKAHPALRRMTHAEVGGTVVPISHCNPHVLSFLVGGNIFAVFNADRKAVEVRLPEGTWNIHVNGDSAGLDILGSAKDTVRVAGISAMILKKKQ